MEMRTRPVTEADLPRICSFPQSAEELFFLSPKARYPLTPEQLAGAIAARADSTVVEGGGQVLAFARLARKFGLLASRASDYHGPEDCVIELGKAPLLPPDLTPVWTRLMPVSSC